MRSYQLDGMEWIKVGHHSYIIHQYTYTRVKCSNNSDTGALHVYWTNLHMRLWHVLAVQILSSLMKPRLNGNVVQYYSVCVIIKLFHHLYGYDSIRL